MISKCFEFETDLSLEKRFTNDSFIHVLKNYITNDSFSHNELAVIRLKNKF